MQVYEENDGRIGGCESNDIMSKEEAKKVFEEMEAMLSKLEKQENH